MIGAGRYDKECTAVREATGASGVILIVFQPDDTSGISSQLTADMLATAPEILRQVADQIEADNVARGLLN